jgi:Glyoxalase-like domain
MIFGLDHLVLCGSRDDLEQLQTRLTPAGFAPVPGKLRFDEIGAHSESLAYGGGGFVEVVYEVRSGEAPRDWFDGRVPRVIGIGVSSDDFERDTADWHWTMDEEQVLEDGTTLRIHAAGPHEHLSPLYLFAMDRPERTLDHPHLGGVAKLTSLTFNGREAALWRRRLDEWLDLSNAIGDVELRFFEDDAPGAVVTPAFKVHTAAGTVKLAASAIELVPYGSSG